MICSTVDPLRFQTATTFLARMRTVGVAQRCLFYAAVLSFVLIHAVSLGLVTPLNALQRHSIRPGQRKRGRGGAALILHDLVGDGDARGIGVANIKLTPIRPGRVHEPFLIQRLPRAVRRPAGHIE